MKNFKLILMLAVGYAGGLTAQSASQATATPQALPAVVTLAPTKEGDDWFYGKLHLLNEKSDAAKIEIARSQLSQEEAAQLPVDQIKQEKALLKAYDKKNPVAPIILTLNQQLITGAVFVTVIAGCVAYQYLYPSQDTSSAQEVETPKIEEADKN